jgi:hypothetical protein
MNTVTLQLLPDNKLIGVCKINYQKGHGYFDYYNMQYQFHILDLETEETSQFKPEFNPPFVGSWCQYMGGKFQLISHTGLIAMNHECSSNICSLMNMPGKGMTIWHPSTGQCVSRLIHEHLDDFAVMPDRQMVTIGGKDNKELRIWYFEPLVLKPMMQEQALNENAHKKSLLPPFSLFNKKRVDQARRVTQAIFHTASKVLPRNRHN